MVVSAISCVEQRLSGVPVSVEVDVANGLPRFTGPARTPGSPERLTAPGGHPFGGAGSRWPGAVVSAGPVVEEE
jgi:hypothetical protein